MKKILFSILFILIATTTIIAQGQPFIVTIDTIIDGDTLYFYNLREVVIFPQKEFKSKREQVKYTKLVRNVKKVYPYAKLAGEKLEMYAPILDTLTSSKERDKYFDIIEEQLWEEYGEDLKKFTISQGAILIKLVDRQCQMSTYQVLKDFRGGFSAFFYQAFARLWGYNLKVKYDPSREDKDIEEIILMIEADAI
ncbi:MAG: DUF4294 domain-containing protein [Bacteroidales bacterium]|jgi:hypothetical protein|nr:DUF4294 domain-containing protein [Bacteroidales bacterium]MDD2204943.1 DUF4294 domain-containing protein [Bacteroidales bacterium]MDD3152782.1 DUF4294 domain-containing protein [Bacteroidales bacterium]MDD3915194.1 DUF4294 domain-containing protein [Bacteroidales bacterium]MDD4634914.1 DUF4294 domain-containing protein [Bacteroidales bacterium]